MTSRDELVTVLVISLFNMEYEKKPMKTIASIGARNESMSLVLS